MELFFQYLRQHRKSLCAFALFSVIFAVVFWLYHLPLAAVLYPALLCLLLGGVFLVTDFIAFRKKHRQLQRMEDLSTAMISDLPAADTLAEADYQVLLQNAQAELFRQQTSTDNRYQNMVDYYTAWAHQIKTPIAAMNLTLQNEDSPLSRKLTSKLFHIEQYADMVLAFLRLDSTTTDFVLHPCDLDGMIRQSIRKFADEFILRKLTIDYRSIHKTVVTDEKWFAFLLDQLLSNALKYTKQGGIRIYLEYGDTLCIQDTGIGIAPEDLPRIFEKGFTGYNGRSNQKASGIGLYLCQRISEKLGLPITITSALDHGTTAHIRLSQYTVQPE